MTSLGAGWLTSTVLTVSALAGGDRPAPHPLLDDLSHCTTITADAARLACLDAATAQLLAADRAKNVVVITRDEVKATQRRRFGLPVDQGTVFADHAPAVDRVSELHTKVVATQGGQDDHWTLTLAEGGRWRTTEPWGNANPKPGMMVDIHAAALGSYVLRAPGQRSVRVARID